MSFPLLELPMLRSVLRTTALVSSLSLLLAARSLNLDVKDIQVNLGQGVKVGN